MISAPATWLWIEWGKSAYSALFVDLVPPILKWLDLPGLRPSVVPDRFVSLVPFLVLMVLTPRLSLPRRVIGTALGFGAIFLSHLAFIVYMLVIQETESLRARPFVSIFPAFILLDAFPIIVWALIAKQFVSEVAARTLPTIFGDSKPT